MFVSSRGYAEYVAMFALTFDDLAGRVLDCSAGAAGFASMAGADGCRVVAVDPAYAMSRPALAEAVRLGLEQGTAIADRNQDRFTWAWFGSPERRLALRREASVRFLADLAMNPGRYVAAALPRLPFRSGAFDLVLCSHLVFTWADQLGLDWHRAALLELSRVGREVRVFPTVVQGRGELVPFWAELISSLADAGLRTEVRAVPYEFQRGANQMLVVMA